MSGLSREDRARIQHWIRKLRSAGGSDDPDAAALTRALALIDQQEEALRAADAWVDAVLQHRGETAAFDAYVAARTTSTKEAG